MFAFRHQKLGTANKLNFSFLILLPTGFEYGGRLLVIIPQCVRACASSLEGRRRPRRLLQLSDNVRTYK